jgi:hypothetical protein
MSWSRELLILAADISPPGIIECEPQKPLSAHEYWSWRQVNGRTCWYPGHPGKPKYQLRWKDPVIPAPPEKGAEPVGSPPASDRPAPTLIEGSFEDRWQGLNEK